MNAPPRPAPPTAGFSLLELLIVLVIIGLLTGLVGQQLLGRVDQGRVTTAEAQIQLLRNALDTMRLDLGRYPTSEEGLALLVEAPGDERLRNRWRGPYLQDELPIDPWGNDYRYRQDGDAEQGLYLYSLGADGAPGGEDDNADIGLAPRS